MGTLSFRTALFVWGICVVAYVLSFVQFLLPFEKSTKGILWIVFFGLAKTAQYTAITIMGAEGYRRLKRYRIGRRLRNLLPLFRKKVE